MRSLLKILNLDFNRAIGKRTTVKWSCTYNILSIRTFTSVALVLGPNTDDTSVIFSFLGFSYLNKEAERWPVLSRINFSSTPALNKEDAHVTCTKTMTGLFALNLLPFIWEEMSKTRASCFITGSKHRETDESTRPAALCFHLFLGVWNPWWSTRPRFWHITWRL